MSRIVSAVKTERTDSTRRNTSNMPARAGALFDLFNTSIAETYAENNREFGSQLFTVDIDGESLYDSYLSKLPVKERQHHECRCCRDFMRRYGALVFIDSEGQTRSAFWSPQRKFTQYANTYTKAVNHIADRVERATITGVFVTSDTSWGQETSGRDENGVPYTHFHVIPNMRHVYKEEEGLTAFQKAAEKREDYRTLRIALGKYSENIIREALKIIKSDTLSRGEKVEGPAQFLYDLTKQRDSVIGTPRNNMIWLAVAKAAPGYCTPSGSMIGTLMDDIISGLSLPIIKRRFNEKMDGLNYMRPKAAPSVGNVAMAERLFKQMGIETSLERRFARFDEIDKIWTSQHLRKSTKRRAGPTSTGIFDHLKTKDKTYGVKYASTIPKTTITFSHFRDTVLPNAISMAVWLTQARMDFMGTLTNLYSDAQPIIQWDDEETRNPFSTYTYHKGSMASSWGLRGNDWCSVNAVMLLPHMWYTGGLENHTPGALFILDGAKDGHNQKGNALFPEDLKSYLHKVRSTIEAYAKTAKMHERELGTANGISAIGVKVKVLTDLGETIYTIDRWI